MKSKLVKSYIKLVLNLPTGSKILAHQAEAIAVQQNVMRMASRNICDYKIHSVKANPWRWGIEHVATKQDCQRFIQGWQPRTIPKADLWVYLRALGRPLGRLPTAFSLWEALYWQFGDVFPHYGESGNTAYPIPTWEQELYVMKYLRQHHPEIWKVLPKLTRWPVVQVLDQNPHFTMHGLVEDRDLGQAEIVEGFRFWSSPQDYGSTKIYLWNYFSPQGAEAVYLVGVPVGAQRLKLREKREVVERFLSSTQTKRGKKQAIANI